jgi:outer membrane lipoprotein LolB
MSLKSAFTTQGKIGIRTPQISESARFTWDQQVASYDIALHDPFGRQVMHLTGEPGLAKLQLENEAQIYHAESASELMNQLLGWEVPVEHALFWIQGQPDPNSVFTRLNATSFEQSNWNISTLDQLLLTSGETAPRKIKLSKDQLSLTLIVTDWQFPQ